MACTKPEFLYAIGRQESGNNYRAVNAGSGALGYWQVMPANVPAWTRESIGYSVSASTFLYSDWIQVAVANHILGGYYDRYGPAGAAAAWYSGQPDASATYGNPPVYQYVNDVLSICGGGRVVAAGGGYIPHELNLGGKDVSQQLRAIGRQLWFGGHGAHGYAQSIANIRR